jgi:hypothetical protein
MRRDIAFAATLGAFWATGALGQNIQGFGTAGNVPVFIGPVTVGNSSLYQLNGNVGIGTTAPDFPLDVVSTIDGSQTYALYASGNSTINFSAAIRGDSLPATGQGSGVIGVTYAPHGWGIIGLRTGPDGSGGAGVMGSTDSTSGFSFGVQATASGASGFSIGVFAEAFSPNAYVAQFSSHGGGNIIVGTQGSYANQRNVFRVDGEGTVFADGGFRPHGADFAESVAVSGDRGKYSAGDLLVIDPGADRHLGLARRPYSSRVAGIYSTRPGVLGSTHPPDGTVPQNEVPLAVIGIVPCKVTAENGPIQAGDLLVSSGTPGHAMRGTDRARMLGAVIGKAMQPLSSGAGVIEVLVTLQ